MTERNHILPPNCILVKPDADITVDRTGLERHDFVDAHLAKAVTGTVVAVCDRLIFCPNVPGADPDAVQESLEFDTDMEVRIGDRVIFRYLATVDETMQIEGNYIIRYDDIFARIEVGWLKPMNGRLLIKVESDERQVAGIKANHDYSGANMVMGKVAYEGTPLRGYRDHPGVSDPDMSLVGKTVVYKKGTAIRIEADDFAQVSKGNYSLYHLSRRHVRAVVDHVYPG